MRVLIVDDELLARRRIRRMLAEHDDCEVVADCGDGGAAVSAILRQKPDLVILDVQMPVLDGFGVLRELPIDRRPIIVFVTAHDEHAIRAFDVCALDYLLKPFSERRFLQTLDRARNAVACGKKASAEEGGRVERLLEQVSGERPRYPDHLLVETSNRLIPVPVERIDWISAAGNRVELHVERVVHSMRTTLQQLEMRLNPARFIRVHRSTIVRLAAIRELHPLFHGDHRLILHDGSELTLSRTFKDALFARWGDRR